MSTKRKRGPGLGVLIKFGIFAVVTSLLTFFIGAQIVGTSFQDRYTLKATFDDVGGLMTNDLVKVSGAPVGKVTKVKVEDGRAAVWMQVDSDVKLPVDSTAEVRWRSLIGQRMLYLVPGRRTGEWLGDDAVISSTKAVVDLGEIVNTLGPLTRNLDPNQLNRILEAVAKMMDGNSQAANAMTVNLQALVGTFASRKDQIASIVDSFATLTDVANTRDRQIAQVIDDLVAISEAFAGNADILGSASGELAQVTRVLDKVISGNQAELERAIGNLDRFVGTAVANLENLEKVVQGLPPALRALFSVTSGGHYTRINVMCLNLINGPCPWPLTLPGEGHVTPDFDQGRTSILNMISQLGAKGGN
ncbi:MCE family protein [Actinocorallia lasiicapitis]